MSGKCEERKKAIKRLIDAWDSLEGGKHYRPAEVEKWLVEKMAPAVKAMRKVA